MRIGTTAATRGPLHYFSGVINPISLSKTACVHNNTRSQKNEYDGRFVFHYYYYFFILYIHVGTDWLDPHLHKRMWINNHSTAKWVHRPRVSSHIIACHNFRQPVIWGTLLIPINRFILLLPFRTHNIHVDITATWK